MTTGDGGRGRLRPDGGLSWHTPIPVGFVGLIVAVVLWGTAYKLSLYHPHPAPSMRTQVAKLWMETRISYVVPIREIKGFPDVRIHFYALAAQNQPPAGPIGVSGRPVEAPAIQVLTAAVPIPSRAPPSFSLSLG